MIGNLAKLSYVRGVSQSVASGLKVATVAVKVEGKPGAVAGQTQVVGSDLPRNVVRVSTGFSGH